MDSAGDNGRPALPDAYNEAFWRALNPDLHISDFPLAAAVNRLPVDAGETERSVARMVKEGYFDTPPIVSAEKAERYSRVVSELVSRGFAPVFAFVYDEFWQLFLDLHPVLEALLGKEYQLTPTDIWGWQVDNNAAAAGWGPHRDMISTGAIRDDGRPRVVNTWMPLTDATPLNACMYVLPQHLDPYLPDRMDWMPKYDMTTIQHLRAVPAKAGSALAWNTRVLHWGGASSEWATHPRLSIAVYFHSKDCVLNDIDHAYSREGFASQAFDRDFRMPFDSRLDAIAGAIQLYASKVRVDYPKVQKELFAFSYERIGNRVPNKA